MDRNILLFILCLNLWCKNINRVLLKLELLQTCALCIFYFAKESLCKSAL